MPTTLRIIIFFFHSFKYNLILQEHPRNTQYNVWSSVCVFYDLLRVIYESKHRNVCLEIFVFVWFSNKTCGIKEKVCLLGKTNCFEVRLLLPNYFTILKFRRTSVPFSSAPASLMSNFQSQSCHIRASPRWFISQLTGVHVEVVLSDLCVRFFWALEYFIFIIITILEL